MLNFALSIGNADTTILAALAGVLVGLVINGRAIVQLAKETRKAWLWQVWARSSGK